MDYAAAANELMRKKLLEDIYERMTDDEKMFFVQMTCQNRSHTEIMQAFQQQQARLERLQRTQQTFGEDFLSNIAGNAAYDVLLWLARRIIK